MALTIIMKIVSAFISIYLLLIFIRILLTWFQGPSFGRPMEILVAITEPYLSYFRRLNLFRTAKIDFSPIVAILVLVIIQNITSTLARVGTITVGIILALILQAVWSAASFLLIFFLILMIIRLIGFAVQVNTASPVWQTLDILIQPVVSRVSGVLSGDRPLSYPARIGITGGVILAAFLVVRFIIQLLTALFMSLPF